MLPRNKAIKNPCQKERQYHRKEEYFDLEAMNRGTGLL
jgi:hypothetical protein